jgi:hypothetical protein
VFPLAAGVCGLAAPPGERRAALRRHRMLWIACAVAAAGGLALGRRGERRGPPGQLPRRGGRAHGHPGRLPANRGAARHVDRPRRRHPPTRRGRRVDPRRGPARRHGGPRGVRRARVARDVRDRGLHGRLHHDLHRRGPLRLLHRAHTGHRRRRCARGPQGPRLAPPGPRAGGGRARLASRLPDLVFHGSPVAMLYPVLEGWSARVLAPAGLEPGRTLVIAAGALAAGGALALATRRRGTLAPTAVMAAVLVFCGRGDRLRPGPRRGQPGRRDAHGRRSAGVGELGRPCRRARRIRRPRGLAGRRSLPLRPPVVGHRVLERLRRPRLRGTQRGRLRTHSRATLQVDPDSGRAAAPWTPPYLVFASTDVLFRPTGRRIATTSATTQFPNPRLELWRTAAFPLSFECPSLLNPFDPPPLPLFTPHFSPSLLL